ncbi:MAG: efflux RND transporter periplasmic adaptor subunit, partial [Acidaminococcales bacterium]|nr:efflux RND transporter periplasmic adaptor subunit [Acidaminococcales bacterium]
MSFLGKKFWCVPALLAALFVSAGCGKSAPPAPPPVPVKTMAAIKKDVSIVNEYAGQIQGRNEVRVQARVSGHVTEKMIAGGQLVKKGQPLFKIDSRPYVSALLSAQAQLAQAQTALSNTKIDTQRYRELYKADAIAEQALTAQEANERQQQALVDAQAALLQKARDDLNDTLVTSPIDGRLRVDDVSVGAYVQPGGTALITVDVIDPVFVVFNMSEIEYLNLNKTYGGDLAGGWGGRVDIALSNGEIYPLPGQVAQIDRALDNNSGTIIIKASFANPGGVLIPGMFARAKIAGAPVRDAVLVPQRAIRQVLDKSYVMTLTAENKVEAKQITPGQKTGGFQIVEAGLSADEIVIVEGLAKVREGQVVTPALVKPEELNL